MSSTKNAFWFLLPAILAVLTVFPIGIQTNLTSDELTAHEADAPGPGMQLKDISSGFSREDAKRPFSIFQSMVVSAVYVPYIQIRGGGLPPYDLAEFSRNRPGLIAELIVIARSVNTFAALGIIVLAFLITLKVSENRWAAAFVALSMALNPNLMFQSSVTYYETCALFWVFLSLFFYVLLWSDRKYDFRRILAFSICAALAISTHERMGGFYVLSIPALIVRLWRVEKAPYLIFFGGVAGALTFCFANNVFGAGLMPVYEYLTCKSVGFSMADRFLSVWGFLRNQIGCHGHAARLIIWNLGGITALIAALGAWAAWRERRHTGLVLLLFPIGYQLVCIGVPGWTAGRYMLGQTLFATLFSAFGVVWLLSNRRRLGILIIVAALTAQLTVTLLVKIADTYFNPIRVVEGMITGSGASEPVRSAEVRGFVRLGAFDRFPETWNKCPDVKFTYLSKDEDARDDSDIVISSSDVAPYDRDRALRRVAARRPPAWLAGLVKEKCYLYSSGPAAVSIQRREPRSSL